MSNKYITLNEGADFRSIAKIMSEKNFVMNHATARNILISALKLLLQDLSGQLNLKISKSKLEKMLHSQELHDALSEILPEAYREFLKEEEEEQKTRKFISMETN